MKKKFKLDRDRAHAPFWVHFFHPLHERIRTIKHRDLIANVVNKLLPKKRFSSHLNIEYVETLKKNGYLMIDSILTEKERISLVKQLSLIKCEDRMRPALGRFSIENTPPETRVADMNNVLHIPEAIKFANNPNVLAIVEGYLGATPIIDSIKSWWSIPGFTKPENEQLFHRDNDGIKFVKLFMYLTDVDEYSGPHKFVVGSHESGDCIERRRYTDDEITMKFKETSVNTFFGKAGTSFLEDTYGLHKGTLPTKDKRLLIQVRYSTLPTIFVSRYTTKSKMSLKEMTSPYVNKYLIKK